VIKGGRLGEKGKQSGRVCWGNKSEKPGGATHQSGGVKGAGELRGEEKKKRKKNQGVYFFECRASFGWIEPDPPPDAKEEVWKNGMAIDGGEKWGKIGEWCKDSKEGESNTLEKSQKRGGKKRGFEKYRRGLRSNTQNQKGSERSGERCVCKDHRADKQVRGGGGCIKGEEGKVGGWGCGWGTVPTKIPKNTSGPPGGTKRRR